MTTKTTKADEKEMRAPRFKKGDLFTFKPQEGYDDDSTKYEVVDGPYLTQVRPNTTRACYSMKDQRGSYKTAEASQMKRTTLMAPTPGRQRDELLVALEMAERNEILRGALNSCAAQEVDRARSTVEAIRITRDNAASYRAEIQANMRVIRAAIAAAKGA